MDTNLQIINNILTEISSIPTSLDETKRLKEICDITQKHLRLTFVGLLTLNLDRNLIIFRTGSGEVGEILLEREHKLPIDGESHAAKGIRFNEIWLTNEKTGDVFKSSLPTTEDLMSLSKVELQYVDTHWWRSPLLPSDWSLSFPLRFNNQTFGSLLIFCENDSPDVKIDESVAYLQNIADEIAIPIWNSLNDKVFYEPLD